MAIRKENTIWNSRLILIFIVKCAILITFLNACVMNTDSISCKIEEINNYYNSELLIDGFEHLFERISSKLIREYKMNLKESEKDLKHVKNVSVDDRISNYILNNENKIIRGVDIKNGIYTILKNYNENKNSRVFHSEPLNNNIINSGLFNLFLIPNELI
ncbi:hypothetical protein FG386_001182 [Cryptosporidium ryanae]|uniref:uncharacterized protein n=1 Tax=Cryptosporidium ryanae TaxID=515981 RepID=UPI00351A9535|nr:hypothetical protein FG386_001182 [Cryptosporidium ryanae]